MWNGKNKAVTFSIDDGCESDKAVIAILNKYGIKGTFNLNSGLFGKPLILRNRFGEITERFEKIKAEDVRETYSGHEVAVHTRTHNGNLTTCKDEEIIEEVESDRKFLESLVGYKIVGMAYPCGFCDDRVARVIKENTPVKYSRNIISTYNFDMQSDLMQFCPTIWWGDEKIFDVAKEFIDLKCDTPKLLYIWGHSFELERAKHITFEKLEKLCETLSGREDIFYGTNAETILDALKGGKQ